MQKNFPFFWGFLVAWSKNACLFSRKVCGIKMKKKRKKVDWKKTDFSSIFFFLCSSSKGVWSASLFSKCGTWQPDPVEMSSTQGSAKPKGKLKFILIFHHYGWNQNSITLGVTTFLEKAFKNGNHIKIGLPYPPWCARSTWLTCSILLSMLIGQCMYNAHWGEFVWSKKIWVEWLSFWESASIIHNAVGTPTVTTFVIAL